jgi:uncharacterized protein (TIGR02145 family)
MKKTIYLFASVILLLSCKKESSNPTTTTTTTNTTNTTDTTKNTNPNNVSISSFGCSNVLISGTLKKGQAASNVSATITYTGGNGKTYLTKSHTSTGVTGLTANLMAGTLANGEGQLVYTISGAPTTAGSAIFEIELGGKSCSINVKVEDLPMLGKPGSNITDNEGNSYKTVIIGTQTWMAENLKTSKYNDGTSIPNITDDTQWSKLTTGAWAYYKNDATNNAKYGKLYNWYALSSTTNDNKNVCPSGWHVPSYEEWGVLTNYLGGESEAGGKMKEEGTTNWNYGSATNTSLFTGLPGGSRGPNGSFDSFGTNGYWWSSTLSGQDGTLGVFIGLNYSVNSTSYIQNRSYGFSIRCIKN